MNKRGIKSLSKVFFIFIICFSQESCESYLEDVPREGTEKNLVVEGEINDFSGPYLVKVSYSSDLNSPNPNPKVSNLDILIEDQNLNQYSLEETDMKGIYSTMDSSIIGELENFYHLSIQSGTGELYKSYPQELIAVPTIDTLIFNFATSYFPEFDSIGKLEDKFFASIKFKDNGSTQDYYRWRIYVNGKFIKKPESIYLENDVLFNGKSRTIIFSSDTLEEKDEVLIEQLSLSTSSFDYWSLLKTQATNLGTPFSPAPALIKGNIKNQDRPEEVIIGHFDVSGKTIIKGIVKKP